MATGRQQPNAAGPGIPAGGIANMLPGMSPGMGGRFPMAGAAAPQPMQQSPRAPGAAFGQIATMLPSQSPQGVDPQMAAQMAAQRHMQSQPPAGFDAFMQQRQQQDDMNAQRAMQAGAMPQFQAQMQQRETAMQGITQADIDRLRNLQMSGDPSFQAESDAFNARANANRTAALQGQFAAQGGTPGGMPPGGPTLQSRMQATSAQMAAPPMQSTLPPQVRQGYSPFGQRPAMQGLQGLAGIFGGMRF